MIAFVPLHEEALAKVLQWRIDPHVTRYMRTDVPNDLEAQHQWFQRIQADSSCVHWLIRTSKGDVGLAYLTELDLGSRNCSCGFYIGERWADRFGGMILAGLVNHVFSKLNFHKIHGEVLSGNGNVLKLHEHFGYRPVGVMKDQVCKDGVWHDLHLFELLRSNWEKNLALYKPYTIEVLASEDSGP